MAIIYRGISAIDDQNNYGQLKPKVKTLMLLLPTTQGLRTTQVLLTINRKTIQ